MSSYHNEWSLLKNKIKSLMNTSRLYYDVLKVNTSDSYNIARVLKAESINSYNLLKDFQNKFEPLLPPLVSTELTSFISDNEKYINDNTMNKELQREQAMMLVVSLSIIENRITYYLGETQEFVRKTVEIAFKHLQRSLIIDENLQERWKGQPSEPAFEKLGGVHLLLHRIWGFKVNADGERTDLVLSEKINESDILIQSVDGLVLTEWKYIKKPQNLDLTINQAKEQAKKYSSSSLNAIELSNYYYLIMVSKDYLSIKNDRFSEDDKIFRVINIAYSPSPPSVASKKIPLK